MKVLGKDFVFSFAVFNVEIVVFLMIIFEKNRQNVMLKW